MNRAAEAPRAPAVGGLALVLVTPGDRPAARTLALANAALDGGVTAVLLREPQLPDAEREALGLALAAACRARGALVLVSRDAGLALRVGADGVQAGWGGPDVDALRAAAPRLQVGRSAHWPLLTQDLRADWITLSPFRDTPRSHPRALLAPVQVRTLLDTPGLPPCVALGGLTEADVPGLPAGLVGVAVLRALGDAADPRAAAARLRAAVDARLRGAARFATPAAAEPRP